MREQTAEVSAPIEQEFLSVIREYERVIYKVCYLYANPNAPLNDLYQDCLLYTSPLYLETLCRE